MAPEVRAIIKDNREKLRQQTEEKLRKAREAVQQQELEWDERKREIADSVRRRPLLMQEPSPGRIREVVEEESEEPAEDEGEMEGVMEEAELGAEEGEGEGTQQNREAYREEEQPEGEPEEQEDAGNNSLP